jgi:hypothetical protein
MPCSIPQKSCKYHNAGATTKLCVKSSYKFVVHVGVAWLELEELREDVLYIGEARRKTSFCGLKGQYHIKGLRCVVTSAEPVKVELVHRREGFTCLGMY